MKNKWFNLAFCLFIFLLLKDINYLLTLIVLIIYWYFTFKDYTFIVLFTFLLLLIPPDKSFDTNTGKIIDLNAKSIIIQNEYNQKLFLITDTTNLNYDDTIKFNCDINDIKEHISDYGFNFKLYYNKNSIYKQGFSDKVQVINKGNSLKNKLYTYIDNINNDNIKKYYNKLFFNYKDESLPDIFLKTGMQFSGLLVVIYSLLKYFLYDKQISIIQIIVLGLLILIFKFEIVLIRLLVSKLLRLTNYSKYDRLGIQIFIMYFLFPNNFLDLSLLYPFIFSIINCFYYDKAIYLYKLVSMFIQSYFFYSFNIIHILLFKKLIFIYGLIFLLSIILIPFINYTNSLFIIFEYILELLNFSSFNIIGKANIYIIIILIISYYIFKTYKVLVYIFMISMILNLFNPFTTITIINVGQGDSILIKTSFNRDTILIDTGKPNAYTYLDSYLKANGISKLDKLIISHNDSDHNGNLDNLKNNYIIDEIVLDNKDIILDNISLKNINLGKYDNDNDNSLIHLLNINNINILFTGDISKLVEDNLVDKYPLLDIDILKASHHGSNTSSSKKFIQSIKPNIALISSGTTYNHPSKEVIETYTNNNVLYFDTKQVGDMTIIFTKFINIFKTSQNQFGIIK